jgi:hypothetical protein
MRFEEDLCRIRKYAVAQVMASLRNLALSLLRLAGAVSIPPASRLRSEPAPTFTIARPRVKLEC